MYILPARLVRALILAAPLLLIASLLLRPPPAVGSGTSQTFPGIDLVPVATGLRQPVGIGVANDGSGRLFIVEQQGRIRILKNGTLLETPFLDIASRVTSCSNGCEAGLFSIAFPPDRKDLFYVTYSAGREGGREVLSRFRVNPANPDLADPASEETLITVVNPYGYFANHFGGQIAFSPRDGFLYWGVGDSDGQEDPNKTAQNPGLLTGKMLRIDVGCCDGKTPGYAIPSTNPFVNRPGYRPEIWAVGLRNPWRFSFDRRTGDLYIADVGQFDIEEIDVQPVGSNGGENYGWSVVEGTLCYKNPECDQTGYVLPAITYDHESGCSVIGGYVATSGPLAGSYIYGDFCSGNIAAMKEINCVWTSETLLDTEMLISTFGQGEDGTLYVADYAAGDLYRIIVSPSAGIAAGPYRLAIPSAHGPPPAPTPTLMPSTLCPPKVSGKTARR